MSQTQLPAEMTGIAITAPGGPGVLEPQQMAVPPSSSPLVVGDGELPPNSDQFATY